MNKSISLEAIKWDAQEFWAKKPYVFRHLWLITSMFFVVSLSDSSTVNLILILLLIPAFGLRMRRYLKLKTKEETKEAIFFFQKKKNERHRNLYLFFIALFFMWICRSNTSWTLFGLLLTVFYGARYLFHIPSIVFKVEDYSLLIERGYKRKRIDFTYTNKVRFVSQRMIFENAINEKIEIKDVEYLSKMEELKDFLSSNFGREKVVSAANGQPLI